MTADAIVVLGCRLPEDGRPGTAIERRVAAGVALLAAGAAPRLVLSGGGTGRRPEAEIMRTLALGYGAPETALLLETRSRDTIENAFCSAELLRREGLSRVIVVSDRYHLLRARLLFGRAGLDVVRVAAPPGRGARDWPMWLREIVAFPRSLVVLALRRYQRDLAGTT
jgi:uncharacterized SAM-binding protein YcdF (DUF218 family)